MFLMLPCIGFELSQSLLNCDPNEGILRRLVDGELSEKVLLVDRRGRATCLFLDLAFDWAKMSARCDASCSGCAWY